MKQGILFDLDGTLADTLQDLADSVDEALAQQKFSGHTPAEYCSYVGNGARMLIKRSVPAKHQGDATLLEQVYQDFCRAYEKRHLATTKPYAGMVEFVQQLADTGVLMGVCTNKPETFARKIVDTLFPMLQGCPLVGGGERFPRKPDPAGALYLAGQLGLQPDQILFVGDSQTDIQTAEHAGMDCLACGWGFRSAQVLLPLRPRWFAATPAELWPLWNHDICQR